VTESLCLIDTCCLINLCALGQPIEEVLRKLPCQLLVAQAVEQERIFIRLDAEEVSSERQRVNLEPAFAAGLRGRAGALTDAEKQLFVSLASRLGDGEAMSIAVGVCRKLPVVTDDRLGRKIAIEFGIATVGTPELCRAWATASRLDDPVTANALRQIERVARYRPKSDVPDGPWWLSLTDRS
jgi:predicted nucleic acid-binding protein